VIYFQVSDIHAVFSSLKHNGVHFLAEPHVVNRTPTSELWLAEFTDPDANQLALMSDVVPGDAPSRQDNSESSRQIYAAAMRRALPGDVAALVALMAQIYAESEYHGGTQI
jgi:hypothetical protein